MPSNKPAVSVTEGCGLLAGWTDHETGGERPCYLVPNAAGGRLFRKQGLRGFLEALVPWGLSAGIDLAAARVVSRLPAEGEVPCWPLRRPRFGAPRGSNGSLRFAFHLPFELAIFRGHFPAVPIVPGALLCGWVAELGREHCGWQHGAANAVMLKFRRILQPGLTYELQIDCPAPGDKLDFHIRLDGATCALGSLQARAHDEG